MKEFKPVFLKRKKCHNFLIINRLKKKEFKHFKLYIGTVGLKALKSNIINSGQISSCLRNITRDCKKKYKIWLFCFPNISISAKSISVRMGTGIGQIKDWIFIIKKNNIFFELKGKYSKNLIQSLENCKKKLSFSTVIITQSYKKRWKNFRI